MADTDVIVVDATSAEETSAVAAAATEAVGSAFREGVFAGEQAARVDQADMVSRAEFDELLRRVAAIDERSVVAVEVAETAVEIAVIEAATSTEGNDAGEGENGEDGETETGEPNPPAKRAEPGADSDAKPAKKSGGYGNPAWFKS